MENKTRSLSEFINILSLHWKISQKVEKSGQTLRSYYVVQLMFFDIFFHSLQSTRKRYAFITYKVSNFRLAQKSFHLLTFFVFLWVPSSYSTMLCMYSTVCCYAQSGKMNSSCRSTRSSKIHTTIEHISVLMNLFQEISHLRQQEQCVYVCYRLQYWWRQSHSSPWLLFTVTGSKWHGFAEPCSLLKMSLLSMYV